MNTHVCHGPPCEICAASDEVAALRARVAELSGDRESVTRKCNEFRTENEKLRARVVELERCGVEGVKGYTKHFIELVDERDAALAAQKKAETERDRLRDAVKNQKERWESLPCGADLDADGNDPSPQDAIVYAAGLAIKAAQAALSGGRKEME